MFGKYSVDISKYIRRVGCVSGIAAYGPSEESSRSVNRLYVLVILTLLFFALLDHGLICSFELACCIEPCALDTSNDDTTTSNLAL